MTSNSSRSANRSNPSAKASSWSRWRMSYFGICAARPRKVSATSRKCTALAWGVSLSIATITLLPGPAFHKRFMKIPVFDGVAKSCQYAGVGHSRLGEIAEELEGRADELDRADPRSAKQRLGSLPRPRGSAKPKEPHGRRSAGLSRGSMKRLMGALARPGLTRRSLNRVPCS